MLEADLALATFVRRARSVPHEDDFPLAVHFTLVADARSRRASVRTDGAGGHEPERRTHDLPGAHPRRSGRRRPRDCSTSCVPTRASSSSTGASDQLAGLHGTASPVRHRNSSRNPLRWAYYPWRRAVVGVLGPRGFRTVRLDRNRNLITADEQAPPRWAADRRRRTERRPRHRAHPGGRGTLWRAAAGRLRHAGAVQPQPGAGDHIRPRRQQGRRGGPPDRRTRSRTCGCG